MAGKKLTFPRIIISNWWELRRQAQKSPDLLFTTESISFLLNISTSTVHVNVLPALRQFELIDKKGALTERGKRWLIDDEYKEVCTDIMETVYPVELLTLVDNPSEERKAIKSWFEEKTHSPMNSVLQMTATYLMLNDGDPKAATDKGETKGRKPTVKKVVSQVAEAPLNGHNGTQTQSEAVPAMVNGVAKRKYTRRALQAVQPVALAEKTVTAPASGDSKVKPAVNINIQLVLTQQTPVEQIEALFAGIGKYLVVK